MPSAFVFQPANVWPLRRKTPASAVVAVVPESPAFVNASPSPPFGSYRMADWPWPTAGSMVFVVKVRLLSAYSVPRVSIDTLLGTLSSRKRTQKNIDATCHMFPVFLWSSRVVGSELSGIFSELDNPGRREPML